jgi:hypothetical protein
MNPSVPRFAQRAPTPFKHHKDGEEDEDGI